MRVLRRVTILTICLILVVGLYGEEAKKLTLEQMRAEIARQGYKFTVDKTSVSHIPLKKLCGLAIPPDWRDRGKFDGGAPREATLPSSYDWRDYGKVTPVQNQGSCGSCWAFGTIGSFEMCVAVAGGPLDNLSEEWMLDCNSYGYSCSGGWWAFGDLDNGAPMESCYPYVGSKGTCYTSCTKYHPMADWYYVGPSSGVASTTDIKNAIYNQGPIAVGVYVNSYFQNYSGGIFTNTGSYSPNHGVVLVGWNDSGGYWIMKNSWGTGWGESGYMRIAYGANNIGYAAAYGVPETVTPQPPVAEFTANNTTVEEGDSVQFTDQSTNSPTTWEWTFEGGIPSTSTAQNPSVTYNSTGTYNVSLTVTNSVGSDTETKTDYITVTEEIFTVGNTTAFGSSSTSNNRRAMPFTMPENGSIVSVTMYHTGGSGNMILGVYDGSSSPQNRLGVTDSTAVSGSTGWQTINLTGSAYVSQGSTVWLAWVYQSNPGIRYQTGSPGRYQSSQTWSGGMPDPFGSGSQTSYIYSIYATYIPGGTTQYDLDTYTVGSGSISLNPAGGTYNQGTVVTLTAIPDSGWQFDNWSGDLSGSTNPTTITMNSDKTVTANFSLTGTTGTVGNDSVFGDSSVSSYRRAMPFTMPENGTITSVTMYHSGGSGDMILAVYDGSSSPQNRLAVTPTTAVSSSTGWQTINLTGSAYVSQGSTVWLAWVYQSNPGIRYQTGSPGRYQSSQTWSGGMPDPFGSGSQTSYIYSIYATYNK